MTSDEWYELLNKLERRPAYKPPRPAYYRILVSRNDDRLDRWDGNRFAVDDVLAWGAVGDGDWVWMPRGESGAVE